MLKSATAHNMRRAEAKQAALSVAQMQLLMLQAQTASILAAGGVPGAAAGAPGMAARAGFPAPHMAFAAQAAGLFPPTQQPPPGAGFYPQHGPAGGFFGLPK